MKKKLLALYSLKFNPFSADIPTSALFLTPATESFCWRIENQVGEGGFALVSGEPGSGKSAALRILADRLSAMQDVMVGLLSRPQASILDFYRELGYLFGVALSPHNRWNGAKALREKWQAQIEASLYRPVLMIDEAQEMNTAVFSELRLLSSTHLDSRSILLVILAGDSRLTDRLHHTDLLAHRQSHPHAPPHGTCHTPAIARMPRPPPGKGRQPQPHECPSPKRPLRTCGRQLSTLDEHGQ